MSKGSQMLRNTMFSSIGLYTEYVLGMVISVIIARHLEPAGFGSYSVIIWMVALGVAIVNSGTGTAAIKFVAELRGSGNPELIPVTLRYLRKAQRTFLLVVLGLACVPLLVAGDSLTPQLHSGVLFGFLVTTISIRSLYMFNIGVAKGFENFRANAIVALVSTPVTLLMVVVAGWLGAPVEAFLGIFVVSSVILYLMSRLQTAPLVPRPVPGVGLPQELLARVRRHMRLTALTVIVYFLVASEIEVLFLKLYATAEMAGHFKVAYQLASGAALLVPGVFGAILLPMMASALKQGSEVAARRYVTSTRYLTLLAAPLVAFGVIFSGAIIGVLYGAAYAPAAPVFAACLAGGALLTMVQGGSSLLVSADRQGSILLMAAMLAVVKIALDIVLIIHYGLKGAMYAYLVVALINIIAITVMAIRVSGASPEWGKLLRIGLAAAIGGLVAYPLLAHLQPLAAIVLGALVVSLVYAPLTLLLGCWDRPEIEHMLQLQQRFGGRRLALLGALLEHAHRRASA